VTPTGEGVSDRSHSLSGEVIAYPFHM